MTQAYYCIISISYINIVISQRFGTRCFTERNNKFLTTLVATTNTTQNNLEQGLPWSMGLSSKKVLCVHYQLVQRYPVFLFLNKSAK